MLTPKLVTVFREGYRWPSLRNDLLAGCIVGILAIPMTLAFGIASGVTPKAALWSGVVGGFFAALLSGSRFQVSGPTGAFIILIAGIVGQFGMGGLILATLMAGLLLVVMGISRLGNAVRYIPYPVIVGFTSAIGLLIATSQLHDLFGLNATGVTHSLVGRWSALLHEIGHIDLWSCAISFLTILVILLWPRVTTAVPGSLIAVVLSTALVWFFDLPVATLFSRFGPMSVDSLPELGWFYLPWNQLPLLIKPILAITLLAGIESLLSAVVADGMSGARHRSNMELIAQGAGNIASALVGGIPITGGVARTVTNIKAGGRSPIAALVHCATVFLLATFFSAFVNAIPIATLSGIVLVIAYNMSEWRSFKRLCRNPLGDVVVLLVTFLFTATVDLVTGIGLGMVVAGLVAIGRLAKASNAECLGEKEQENELYHYQLVRSLPDVELFELSGSLFFAAAEKFKTALRRIQYKPRLVILDMSRVIDIDATGIHLLSDFFRQMESGKSRVILCGVRPKVRKVMERTGLLSGDQGLCLCQTIEESVEKARRMLEPVSSPADHPINRASLIGR